MPHQEENETSPVSDIEGQNETSSMSDVDGQNGQDGQDGQNGQDGQDGQNGQNGHDGPNGDTANSPLYFWSEQPIQTGFLSQWYPAPFGEQDEVGTLIFYTAEHHMMYHKAILFADLMAAARILQCSHPRDAKAIGRQVENFDRDVWEQHREQIVFKGNMGKFLHPMNGSSELADKLLATGDRELVEASPEDRIWGIGYVASEADANRETWGLNLMGRALMRVRAELPQR